MPKLEHHRIFEIQEDSAFECRLHNLFKATISDEVSLPHFRKLFSKYENMDMYIMKKDGKDIGMSYFMFCKNPQNKKDLFIRIGIGIIKEERSASHFPKSLILKTMLKAKCKYPFKNVCMVGITMNPIVYLATCKYWKYTYPNPVLDRSDEELALKNRIVDLFHLNEVENDVIGIPFSMPGIEDAKKKFSDTESDNAYIKYFASKVNTLETNKGLLTIIPITLNNLSILVIRKKKTDVMRSIYNVLDQKIMPIFEDYIPAR